MNLSSSKFATLCGYRSADVFCSGGFLFYSKAEPGQNFYKPAMQERVSLTCPACEGRGMLLTAEGKELLTFLNVFARSQLHDLVDEVFEERKRR